MTSQVKEMNDGSVCPSHTASRHNATILDQWSATATTSLSLPVKSRDLRRHDWILNVAMLQHKRGEGGEFTKKYRVNRLAYYEVFEHVDSAIRRETEIKKWQREKKVALIEKKNPTWEDLAADWGQQVPMTYSPVQSTP